MHGLLFFDSLSGYPSLFSGDFSGRHFRSATHGLSPHFLCLLMVPSSYGFLPAPAESRSALALTAPKHPEQPQQEDQRDRLRALQLTSPTNNQTSSAPHRPHKDPIAAFLQSELQTARFLATSKSQHHYTNGASSQTSLSPGFCSSLPFSTVLRHTLGAENGYCLHTSSRRQWISRAIVCYTLTPCFLCNAAGTRNNQRRIARK